MTTFSTCRFVPRCCRLWMTTCLRVPTVYVAVPCGFTYNVVLLGDAGCGWRPWFLCLVFQAVNDDLGFYARSCRLGMKTSVVVPGAAGCGRRLSLPVNCVARCCRLWMTTFSTCPLCCQVLQAVDDDLVYADVDHTEIYAYGPLSYKGTATSLRWRIFFLVMTS
jgi:hypothetical protein